MARYDQDPAFTTPWYGLPDLNPGQQMSSPGSQGDAASTSCGPVVGDPVVSSVYLSSQLPEGRPRQPVRSGDTSGMSSDTAVPQPLPFVGLMGGDTTGAGDGQVVAGPHPNSNGMPR